MHVRHVNEKTDMEQENCGYQGARGIWFEFQIRRKQFAIAIFIKSVVPSNLSGLNVQA